MESFSLTFPGSDDRLNSMRMFAVDGVVLKIGTGFLKAGTRMPDRGVSAHSRREITLVLEWGLTTTSADETRRLGAGDIVTIPADQEQHTVVHEDTRLLWIFLAPNPASFVA